jgi:hypothetical protein
MHCMLCGKSSKRPVIIIRPTEPLLLHKTVVLKAGQEAAMCSSHIKQLHIAKTV